MRAYTPIMAPMEAGSEPDHQPEVEPGFWDPDESEDVEPPPLTWRESMTDATKGLVALLVVSVGVLVLYVVGGVFLGVLTWAAPAVLAVGAAIALARYLSRRK